MNLKIRLFIKIRMTTNILTAFNDHFEEFVNDILYAFPNDPDILTAKNAFLLARKTNPKLTARAFKLYVVEKYRKEIESGNIEFFINKDYKNDAAVSPCSDKVTEAIDRLRNPVKLMNEENQQKCMKYIQNLTKLTDLINIYVA
jgi:hypothetical protein